MNLQGRRFHQSKGAFTRAIIFQYQGQGALGTRMFTIKSDPELNLVMSNSNVASILFYKQFKVSATLQDRPRADRCSAFIFLINPNKPYIFWKLNSSGLWLIHFKNLKIVKESVIETIFAKVYVYVNSPPVPLRMTGRER